jgi:hypothetical protein
VRHVLSVCLWTVVLVSLGAASSAQQAPFGGTPRSIANGSTIQAEDYDTGGSGVAYSDTDAANNGGQYRTDPVDIEVCGDTGGGFNVGWVRTDEWIEFTVNVQTTGTYTLTARVASGASTGSFRVELPVGTDRTGTIPVASTGGWQTWTNLTRGLSLPAGQQVMRVHFSGGDFNLNSLTFTTGGTPSATATSTPTATARFTATPTATGRVTATPTSGSFRVLVFSKTAGFRHDSIPAGISAIQQLGATNNFSVTATEDAAQFGAANLAQYQDERHRLDQHSRRDARAVLRLQGAHGARQPVQRQLHRLRRHGGRLLMAPIRQVFVGFSSTVRDSRRHPAGYSAQAPLCMASGAYFGGPAPTLLMQGGLS